MIARGAPFGGNPFGMLILVVLILALLQGGLAGPIMGVVRQPASLEAWTAFIGFVVAIALGITVHEFMHAFAAHRLGDDTARHMGRLTLDPRAHLDLWGSLLIVLIGFGYGRPVPVSEGRLRSPLAYSLVAVAGPLTNVALAFVAGLPLRYGGAEALGDAYADVLRLIVVYNCLLAVFNLLPLPPLDGSKVVYGLLPPRQAHSWRQLEQYGPLILIGMIFILPYLRIDVLGPLVVRPALVLAGLLGGRGLF